MWQECFQFDSIKHHKFFLGSSDLIPLMLDQLEGWAHIVYRCIHVNCIPTQISSSRLGIISSEAFMRKLLGTGQYLGKLTASPSLTRQRLVFNC
jgi:hypothetical protein